MTRDDPGEHVAQVGLRINAVHLASFDVSEAMIAQCSPPAIGAGEEMIFTPERDRPDCALDDIGVDLDTAVVEEASKAVPARERVADCSGDGRFAGDGGKLGLEPKTRIVEERLGAALPRLATFVGGKTANVGFDRIERGDADKGLRRDRRRRLHLDLVELPAHVAPTESERDVTVLSELRIGAVAIDLQDAAESCEMLGRPRMLAVGRIDVGNAWRSVAGPRPLVG